MKPVLIPNAKDDQNALFHDEDSLYQAAKDKEQQGDYNHARVLLDRLDHAFPTHPYHTHVTFMRLRLDEASTGCSSVIAGYQALQEKITRSSINKDQFKEWPDVYFRLARCLGNMHQEEDAYQLMSALMQQAAIARYDRLDAAIMRGYYAEKLNKLEQAEQDWLSVLQDTKADQDDILIRALVADATFNLAELSCRRFNTLELSKDERSIEERLEQKSTLLIQAQNYYIRTIRVGSAEQVAASSYKIGYLYEKLHQDLIKLAPPEDLSSKEQDLYNKMLKQKIGVLLKKASLIYHAALENAARMGIKNQWIDTIKQAQDALKRDYPAP